MQKFSVFRLVVNMWLFQLPAGSENSTKGVSVAQQVPYITHSR